MGEANLRRGRTRLLRRRPAAKTETAGSERFCYRRASRKGSSWPRSVRFQAVSHAARAVRAIRECKAICAAPLLGGFFVLRLMINALRTAHSTADRGLILAARR